MIYDGDYIKYMSNYITTTENALVSVIEAERYIDVLEKFPHYKEVKIKGAEPLLYDNNPLLIFYYIKETN